MKIKMSETTSHPAVLKRLNILFELVLACLLSTILNASELPGADQIPFHHLSVEDGLSQVTVNDITQDELGFMWFATEDGLNRYDGKSFLQFRNDAIGDFKISGNIINFVFNDSHNRLWIGTNGQGIDVKADNQFSSVQIMMNGEIKSDVIATVLFEDENKNIWMGSWGDGLFKYSEIEQEFQSVDSESIYKKIWTLASYNKQLYLGTGNHGIAHIKDNKILPFEKAAILASNSVKALYIHHNNLLIGTDGSGLWEFNGEKNLVRNIKLSESFEPIVVHKIYSDQSDRVWVGTAGSGIFRKNVAGRWSNQKVSNEKQGLSNNRVLSLFQDLSGVFWVGTEGAGLNYYDPFSILFRNISQGSDSKKNINDKMIYAIKSDENGDWWIGTESGGVNHWDNKLQQFHYYTVESGHLLHNTVRALIKTNIGIFAGTIQGFSLISFNGELLKKWDRGNLNQLPHNAVLSFSPAEKNKIWIGTYSGLILFNFVTEEIENVFLESSLNGPFEHGIIISLLSSQNKLFVGTLSDGLYSYDYISKKWVHLFQDKKTVNLFGSKAIYSINASEKGDLWLGTKGDGVFNYDPISKKINRYTKKHGLPNNVIYGILTDKNKKLWVSTNAGLSSFDNETNSTKNFTLADGIQGSEFNVGAYHKRNDILMFGGINGVTWFDQTKDSSNPFSPETHITNIRVLNENISDKPNNEIIVTNQKGIPQSLILAHNKTMFTIEFAALHFSSPKQNSFKYRLVGLDNKWISSINMQSEATFTGLNPGLYQFEVIAISKDGLVDQTPATMEIILRPPFWKTWWAYSIYVLVSLIVIWRYQAFLKRKLQFQENLNQGLVKINDLKERLAKTEKMAILGELSSNVAHSLRNPLASIRTSAELLEDDPSLPQFAKSDAKNIISEVDRLSTWIKELLAYSRTQSSHMEPLDIVASCEEIINSYQKKFHQNQIQYHFTKNIDAAKISMDAILFQHMLHSLLDNAIEAIMDEGVVNISVSNIQNNKIELSIEDSGSGIKFTEQTQIFSDSFSTKSNGLGMGLSLVKRIVERHDATIEVTSEEKIGSKFTITFNLFQE